jgi:hypothetical protein
MTRGSVDALAASYFYRSIIPLEEAVSSLATLLGGDRMSKERSDKVSGLLRRLNQLKIAFNSGEPLGEGALTRLEIDILQARIDYLNECLN